MSVSALAYLCLVLINLILLQAWYRVLLFASWFAVAIASFLLALRG